MSWSGKLLEQLVPPITAADLRAFQRLEFSDRLVAADFFATTLPPKVCQGDIIGPLPLRWWEHDGEIYEESVLAMLISHSCDFDHDATALFAPCYPFDRYRHMPYASSIQAQEKSSLFFLPEVVGRSALVVDLNQTQPFSTEAASSALAGSNSARVSSFSDIGYVLFALKLTHHLLRPEPKDEVRGEAKPNLWARIVFSLSEMRRNVLYVLGVGRNLG